MKRVANGESALTNALVARGFSGEVPSLQNMNRKERRMYDKIKRKMEKKGTLDLDIDNNAQ